MSTGIVIFLLLLAAATSSSASDPLASANNALETIEPLQCLNGDDPVGECKSPELVSCIDAAGSSFGSMRSCMLNEAIALDSLIDTELRRQAGCFARSGRTTGEAYSIEQSITTEQLAWEAYRQAAISSELALNHDGAFLKSQGYLEAAAVALNLSRERARKVIHQSGVSCR